eukprot:12662574-Alexandrium_andersonii.AAC.1
MTRSLLSSHRPNVHCSCPPQARPPYEPACSWADPEGSQQRDCDALSCYTQFQAAVSSCKQLPLRGDYRPTGRPPERRLRHSTEVPFAGRG